MKKIGFLLLLVLMLLALSVCAVAADPVYLDGTGKTAGAYTDLKSAVDALPDEGGTVIVCGDTAMAAGSQLTLPTKSGKVTIKCADGTKFKFKLAYSMKLGSETEFDNIELVNANRAWGAILACGHKLTMGEGVTTSIENTANRAISIYGGNTGNVTTDYDSHLVVKGGEWRMIFGGNHTGTFNGNSTVEVSGVTITNKLSGKTESGSFNGTSTLIADLRGSKTVTATTYLETPTLLVDEGYEAELVGNTYMQSRDVPLSDTVYVDGTGATADAYAVLEKGISMLLETGGTIIVSGDTTVGTVGEMLTLPAKNGKITIVGENGAKLKIAHGITLACEVEFDNIELVNISTTEGFIAADGYKLTIGAGVTTSRENTERWLTVLGGNKTSELTEYDSHLVIRAGTYRYIYGGNSKAAFYGNSTVELSNVTAGTISAENESGFFGGTSTLIADLRGDKTVTADRFAAVPTFRFDEGCEVVMNGTTYSQRKIPLAFVSDASGDNDNDGVSAEAPKKDFGTRDGTGAHALLKNGGKLILCGGMYTVGDTVWTLNGSGTVTAAHGDASYKAYDGDGAPQSGFWSLADGTDLTAWSNLTLDNMILTHGGDTAIRVSRAVFAITDTVDLVSAGGTHTLIVEKGAIAILSEAAQAFFTVTGEGEVVSYDAEAGVVIPNAYLNGSLAPIYNSQAYVQSIAEKYTPTMRYEEGEDFSAWKTEVTAKLNELLGLPLEACEDDLFRITAKTEYDTYTRVDFEFQSEPGYFVKAAMLIPAGATGKLPCVITLQGHTTGMHISLGEALFSGDEDTIAEGNDLAVQAVQNGMIAVAVDQRYMGNAGQNADTGKATCTGGTTVNSNLYGRTPIGERVWDVQRLIDVLFAHFGDHIDAENLICLGNSVGGTTAFYASCLDERIKITVPSAAVCTYETSVVANDPCRCYDIPGFEQYFDMGDLGMLIAPRKLIVVSGNADEIFPIDGAEESVWQMQVAYEMLDAIENCVHVICDGGHMFYPDDTWVWVVEALTATESDSTATADDIVLSDLTDDGVERIYDSVAYMQYLGRTKEPLMRYKDGEDFTAWRTEAKAKLAELLGLPLEKCTDDHFRILAEEDLGTHTRIDFEFQSEENYFVKAAMLIPAGATGKLPAAITVQGHSTGMHISLGESKFDGDDTLIAGGRDFALRTMREGVIGIAIEQRYMGTAGQSASGAPACNANAATTRDTYHYGRTPIGERVWDIQRTIDVLEKYFSDSIDFDKLILLGNSGGGTATFYASCLEDRIKISVPSCAFSTFYDSIVVQWHCRCNYVPGVAKYFDMGDIGMLIAPKKLLVVNGASDGIFPIAKAREQYTIIEKAYGLMNVSEDCMLLVGNGGHQFYPDDAWPILHEWLGTEREAVDTVYLDGTGATVGAFVSLAEAISRLPDEGGTVIVSGETVVGTSGAAVTLPSKSGKVTITSENGAKLIIARTIILGSETEFDNIELCNASADMGFIYGAGNKMVFGENIVTSISNTTDRWLTLVGGDSDEDVASTHVIVKSGKYRNIFGGNNSTVFTGDAKVEVSNVTLTNTLSGKSISNNFAGTYELIADLRGNKTVTAGTFAETPELITDEGYVPVLVGKTYSQVPESMITDTVYVDGTGATEGAYTSLEEAISMLPDEGGTVIVCGDTVAVLQNATKTLPAKSGPVLIEGADKNVKLTLRGWLILSSATTFSNLTLYTDLDANIAIYANGNLLTIEEDVLTAKADGARWMRLFGGTRGKDVAYDTHLVVKAGTYRDVFGASDWQNLTGSTLIELSNVTVELKLMSAGNAGGGKGYITGTGEIIADLRGGKTVTVPSSFTETPTFRVDAGYEAVLSGTTYKQEKVECTGDVNGDGAVTVADVLLILKAILNDTALENADVSDDGALSLADVMRVLKAAAK